METAQELETLQEQSRWSAKRVVLIYWFALMFLGSGAAIGLGFTALNPTYLANEGYDHSQITDPHPENCTECHADTVSDWNDTGHAYPHTYGWYIAENTTASTPYYYVNWTNLGRTVNWTTADGHGWADYCAHCWTTGWENQTNPDPNDPPWDYWGITCTACHDPAGAVDGTKEVCEKCHTPSAHSTDHHLSAHNNSIDILARPYAGDSCAHCVTGQSTYAHWEDLTKANIANLNSISCPTCHDPHSAEYELQLRDNDTTELCGQCHNSEGRWPSTHHAEYQFWTDSGNIHNNYADGCTTCHGYQLVIGRYGPAVHVNHTWEIHLPDACNQTGCHVNNAATKIASFEANEVAIETLFDEWHTLNDTVVGLIEAGGVDEWRIDGAEALLEESLMLLEFVEADPGHSFHNPTLATTTLNAAIDKLEAAQSMLEEECYESMAPYTTCPEDEEEDSPGFTFMGVLLAIGLLGAAALFLRRRKA
ncbi:MAG: ammonia-forming cytochrome c nitrite reductase subunit c552 [Candidatus Hodarchaeales archaeon]|jgi:predicted CXXCH cytochrome family protein